MDDSTLLSWGSVLKNPDRLLHTGRMPDRNFAVILQPCSQYVSASAWDNVKKPAGADDVSI
ncbi:hypothetical protein ACQXX4_11025, partial [Corynebacterium diphtheriae]